jgi:hypothetical protein
MEAPAPKIDPTAVIHATAVLAEGMEVGPFCFIGPAVNTGCSNQIQCLARQRSSHQHISEGTTRLLPRSRQWRGPGPQLQTCHLRYPETLNSNREQLSNPRILLSSPKPRWSLISHTSRRWCLHHVQRAHSPRLLSRRPRHTRHRHRTSRTLSHHAWCSPRWNLRNPSVRACWTWCFCSGE